MPWEYRGQNGPYYTRSRRVGGRVVREYVGKGPLAELAAALDEEERLKREAVQQAMRERLAEWDAMAEEVRALGTLTKALMRADLQARGFHQHKGQWRRKREPR